MKLRLSLAHFLNEQASHQGSSNVESTLIFSLISHCSFVLPQWDFEPKSKLHILYFMRSKGLYLPKNRPSLYPWFIGACAM